VNFLWRVVDAFTLISLGYLVFYGIDKVREAFMQSL